jgi:hypothetical protein
MDDPFGLRRIQRVSLCHLHLSIMVHLSLTFEGLEAPPKTQTRSF